MYGRVARTSFSMAAVAGVLYNLNGTSKEKEISDIRMRKDNSMKNAYFPIEKKWDSNWDLYVFKVFFFFIYIII